MVFLKEKIGEKYFQADISDLFKKTETELINNGFKIISVDNPSQILFDCPSKIIDVGLWKCWSKRAIVSVKPKNAGALLEVFLIPSLFTIRPPKSVVRIDDVLRVIFGLKPS